MWTHKTTSGFTAGTLKETTKLMWLSGKMNLKPWSFRLALTHSVAFTNHVVCGHQWLNVWSFTAGSSESVWGLCQIAVDRQWKLCHASWALVTIPSCCSNELVQWLLQRLFHAEYDLINRLIRNVTLHLHYKCLCQEVREQQPCRSDRFHAPRKQVPNKNLFCPRVSRPSLILSSEKETISPLTHKLEVMNNDAFSVYLTFVELKSVGIPASAHVIAGEKAVQEGLGEKDGAALNVIAVIHYCVI